MQARLGRMAAIIAIPSLGACAADAQPSGTGVKIAVAPLTLPGIAEVCYGLSVHDAFPTSSANTVWSNPSVCSGQYGNGAGGDVAYVGPCDADTPSTTDNLNWIELTLNTIQVAPGEGSYPNPGAKDFLDDQFTTPGDGDADFMNPCPASAPCQLKFECKENEDVAVTFNLTVMEDANQGFFDIAVNFEDVFCSAKFETCYNADGQGGGEPITLLHGPGAGDAREWTGVAALACTVGADTGAAGTEGDISTQLLMTQPVVTCDGGVTFVLPLDGQAAGNHSMTATTGTGTLYYGLYYDTEDLDCGNGPGSCNKVFYNIAFNVQELADQGLANCSLAYVATAIRTYDSMTFDYYGDLADPASQYGAIRFGDGASLPLTGASGPACVSHQLGAEGSLVRAGYISGSDYVSATAFAGFDYHAEGTDPAWAYASGPQAKYNGAWKNIIMCAPPEWECDGKGDNNCEGNNPGGWVCCCPGASPQ